ncbi:MAG TPA: hypothetical protein VFG04_09505 [Planctomycetaceae bacterium]|jgi:hypothetical protein|nr:hypothetical protein [Planctomycetaceae bacterium]
MKHASAAALDRLDSLLDQIRKQRGLKERKRSVFYRGSSAFLHFHEDPAGMFADVRTASVWERLPVSTRAQQRDLLAKVRISLR